MNHLQKVEGWLTAHDLETFVVWAGLEAVAHDMAEADGEQPDE